MHTRWLSFVIDEPQNYYIQQNELVCEQKHVSADTQVKVQHSTDNVIHSTHHLNYTTENVICQTTTDDEIPSNTPFKP